MISFKRTEKASKIIATYDHSQPLAGYLKDYFRLHPNMGSTDRKICTALVYAYYRLGKSLQKESLETQITVALFLCGGNYSYLLSDLAPRLAQHITKSLSEKLAIIQTFYPAFKPTAIFPFSDLLSAGIDRKVFTESLLMQPNLFIRLKKGCEELVKDALNKASIDFVEIDSHCLALANGTKLDNFLADIHPRPFEIQDYASQQTKAYFRPKKQQDTWWDCCAGSGGKSLLLHDEMPGINLSASDSRASSLRNLAARFNTNGIAAYQSKVLDLTRTDLKILLADKQFDGILLDAPCSGSGSLIRTPEASTHCTSAQIAGYQQLQKIIATAVLPYLKPKSPLIYITCSVFEAENEEVVKYLTQTHAMQVECMEIIPGYTKKADTLFVARLNKPFKHRQASKLHAPATN